MAWLLLSGAIVSEVIATLALRGTAGAFRPAPLAIVVVGYLISFTLTSYALRTLNVGVLYAIWSGAGTAGVAAASVLLYGERLTLTTIGGMALIVAGVVVVVTSGVTSHG